VIGRPTAGGDPGRARVGVPRRTTTTGRSVVVFADPDQDGAATLRRLAGLTDVADSRDAEPGDADARALRQADAVVFPGLGLAVAAVDPRRLADDAAVLAVTPELVQHVLPEVPEGYLAGYRNAVTDLTGRLLALPGDTAEPTPPPLADTPQYTWGLQATEVPASPRTGRGIRVAVLDTGFDTAHPDFAGRAITATSFVAGQSPQDGHGHGTHCVGTACGPRTPQSTRGYGIAPDAEVFVGKVLGDDGSGTDAEILAGIAWAVRTGCQVISMSLGADVTQPSPAYTAAGRRALDQGSLILAAAGNNANRGAGRSASSVCPPTARRSSRSARWTPPSRSPGSPPAAAPSPVGRSTSPRPGWTSTRPGRCPTATGRSAARAWRRRTSPAWPRCGPRRPGCAGGSSGRR
jgi:subtilisin family serine protease